VTDDEIIAYAQEDVSGYCPAWVREDAVQEAIRAGLEARKNGRLEDDIKKAMRTAARGQYRRLNGAAVPLDDVPEPADDSAEERIAEVDTRLDLEELLDDEERRFVEARNRFGNGNTAAGLRTVAAEMGISLRRATAIRNSLENRFGPWAASSLVPPLLIAAWPF